MKLEIDSTMLELCEKTGMILNFSRSGFPLFKNQGGAPLLRILYRSHEGTPYEVMSDANSFSGINSLDGVNVISFKSIGKKEIDADIRIIIDKPTESFHFYLDLIHRLDGYIESTEYPGVILDNNLIATGGDATLFWPSNEGILIEDATLREKSGFKYRPFNYPNHGWGGYYPGSAGMSFLAYYRKDQGLYFAAHDPNFGTKEVEWDLTDTGIRLFLKSFVGGWKKGRHTQEFPIILGGFQGDWMRAAGLYRDWIEKSSTVLPPKIKMNSKIPDWIQSSPVVVTYPITGSGHHSGPTEANEFFPYVVAMPIIDRLAASAESPILALLMHWEGTAPWAPPYSWPPLGGEIPMKQFANELHSKGHHLGLYCSGVAWTNRADTGTGKYNRELELMEKGYIRHMCQGPKGERRSLICNGEGIRYGYDICTSTEFARQVMSEEAVKIAKGDIDYIQLFDQNLGGASYQCYDEDHGHNAAPGPWQAKSMRLLLQRVREELNKAGKGDVVLGCEAAAADAYVDQLPMNDLRFNMGFNYGRPVPAYSFVYHEYVVNFMGNQVEAGVAIDFFKSPENIFLRMAHSFIAGDLLTLILGEGGKIHWSWCTQWSVPFPEQEPIISFTKNLNAWRRGIGKEFLVYGRMIEPLLVKSEEEYDLHLNGRGVISYPSVMTSRWRSNSGSEAQFVVNFRTIKQRVVVQGRGVAVAFNGEKIEVNDVSSRSISFTMPPLTALMIRGK